MQKIVHLYKTTNYNPDLIYKNLPDSVFSIITPGNTVVLKPNWVRESHVHKPHDWDYVITHPAVVTAVLKKVLDKLGNSGTIIITDGPQTDSSFEKILSRYPVDEWRAMAGGKNVKLDIFDLREDEWINKGDVTVSRKKLPGDPKGKTLVNLAGDKSEFFGHNKSKRGYYGADYNINETNEAHDGYKNLYSVSRTVMDADVFINLPKLKTHKKAGITCCLKNLVGINTYKNYLPHHSEGGPSENGDQYPAENINAKIEGPLMAFFKQKLLGNTTVAKLFRPVKKVGKLVFGDTEKVIRSGNWYGNDTVWRMILDLNKVFFYANPDGTFRANDFTNTKKYIGIVDAVIAGEGNGPLAPLPVNMGYIICGTNPVSIDYVAALLMGFDPDKIPSIKNAFQVRNFNFCPFAPADISVSVDDSVEISAGNLPAEWVVKCKPHFGWQGHIEKNFLG